MALIKCPECGREISDTASACPGCGAPSASPAVLFISKDRAQCSSALLSMA